MIEALSRCQIQVDPPPPKKNRRPHERNQLIPLLRYFRYAINATLNAFASPPCWEEETITYAVFYSGNSPSNSPHGSLKGIQLNPASTQRSKAPTSHGRKARPENSSLLTRQFRIKRATSPARTHKHANFDWPANFPATRIPTNSGVKAFYIVRGGIW